MPLTSFIRRTWLMALFTLMFGLVMLIIGHVVWTDSAEADSTMKATTHELIKAPVREAIQHAREASNAGKQDDAKGLITHAQVALDKAKEAQRAGHNEYLNVGVYALGEAIEHGRKGQIHDAREHALHAIMRLSQAAGLQIPDESLEETGESGKK